MRRRALVNVCHNHNLSIVTDEYVLAIRNDHNSPLSLSVLDMCCGKGGDLLKWRNNDVKRLICVDLASVSVEQCERRYNEMKERNAHPRSKDLFDAEFVVADCTKVRLIDLSMIGK